MTFRQETCTVWKHKEFIHSGIRYSCNYCDYQAATKWLLKKHKGSSHERIIHACYPCNFHTRYLHSIKTNKQTKTIADISQQNEQVWRHLESKHSATSSWTQGGRSITKMFNINIVSLFALYSQRLQLNLIPLCFDSMCVFKLFHFVYWYLQLLHSYMFCVFVSLDTVQVSCVKIARITGMYYSLCEDPLCFFTNHFVAAW